MKQNNERKEIEVVTGDGNNLNISPVYDHIKSNVIRSDEKKGDIVIPKSSDDKSE